MTVDDPVDAGDGRPRRRGRGVLVVSAVLLTLALFAGGWGAALAFRSPAQIDAAALPPERSVITAQVREGELADVINVQGVVTNVDKVSSAMPNPGSGGSITLSPLSGGERIDACDLVLEINNQPLFAMPGSFPFFRAMSRGATGRDVEQLQGGLKACGYPVTVDGIFGSGTEVALRDLFADAGYELPAADAEMESPDASDSQSFTPHSSAESDAATRQVSVPSSALLVVPVLPATIVSVPKAGAIPENASVVTSSGEMIVTTSVVPAVAAQLSAGMTATIQVGAVSVPLVLADFKEAQGEDGPGTFDVIFRRAGPDAGELHAGAAGVVSITREVVAEKSLLVPSRAVLSRGEGRYVLRRDGGDFREVQVAEDGVLNGTSAVSLIGDGQLEVGDEVRVK